MACSFMSPDSAFAVARPGGTCSKINSSTSIAGVKYTCVKSGKNLVWEKSVTAQTVDYSSCLDDGTTNIFDLRKSSYSNVAEKFGLKDAYQSELVNISSLKFGYGELSFSNTSSCKVKVKVSGNLTCYAPLTSIPNQARSINIFGGSSGTFEVPAKSTKTFNVKLLFPVTSRTCELTSFQKVAGGSASSYGLPFIGFGSDISQVTLEVTGSDPLAQQNAEKQAGNAASLDVSIGSVKCVPGSKCPLGSVGPGGGIVFYDAGVQMSWGRYIEVAPAKWFGTPKDPTEVWCGSYPRVSSNFEVQISDTNFQRTLGPEIGKGKANSAFIVANCITGFKGAAALATEYLGGGKNDWFIPSTDELNELCKFAQSLPSGSASTPCGNSGKLRAGLILTAGAWYWSSTEVISTSTPPSGTVWTSSDRFLYINGRSAQKMDTGAIYPLKDRFIGAIRPVRYFS
jgi:hypothetical protein